MMEKAVSLYCVFFISIRFKVNKDWLRVMRSHFLFIRIYIPVRFWMSGIFPNTHWMTRSSRLLLPGRIENVSTPGGIPSTEWHYIYVQLPSHLWLLLEKNIPSLRIGILRSFQKYVCFSGVFFAGYNRNAVRQIYFRLSDGSLWLWCRFRWVSLRPDLTSTRRYTNFLHWKVLFREERKHIRSYMPIQCRLAQYYDRMWFGFGWIYHWSFRRKILHTWGQPARKTR